MKTNVKAYTDAQLLSKVKSLPDFNGIPKNYWLIGISSNEDETNINDDKFYLFKGKTFVKVFSGTTNSGLYGLKNFAKWNKKGVFVLKTNQWIYDFWKTNQLHKGKMKAWRQNKPCYHYRDGNKNGKSEEIGKLFFAMCGINFHTQSYKIVELVKRYIGGWSTGCQSPYDIKDYYESLSIVDPVQEAVSYCILKEF